MNELRWDFADLREQEDQSAQEELARDSRQEPELQLVSVAESEADCDRDDPFIQQWIAERLSSGL